MPSVPLVGLFETAFYQCAPEAMMRYAVPDAWHDSGVRRWGFHGASHKFIAERTAELLGRDDVAERARRTLRRRRHDARRTSPICASSPVISAAVPASPAFCNGVAIGNSLGMSPQSGLPQNNRVGDLDAARCRYVDEDARAQRSRKRSGSFARNPA